MLKFVFGKKLYQEVISPDALFQVIIRGFDHWNDFRRKGRLTIS